LPLAREAASYTWHMALRVILFTGLGLAAVGIIYFLGRKSEKFVDLGAVSASWLAEHRVGPGE